MECAQVWPRDLLNEKQPVRSARKSMSTKSATPRGCAPAPPACTITDPVRGSSSPIPVRVPTRTTSATCATAITDRNHVTRTHNKTSPRHDPKALPPAVAALLAVTQIPPRRPKRRQDGLNCSPRISIDQMIEGWAEEDNVDSSYSSSAGLSILWEDSVDRRDQCASEPEPGLLSQRSASDESLPSLEADECSILSSESLGTPESVQSRRSNSRKDKPRSLPIAEECASDHPLIEVQPNYDDKDIDLFRPTPLPTKTTRPKPKSRFTSNLTLSIQNLKTVALNSISSFSFGPSTPDTSQRSPSSPLPDEVLWSHPFLFPRFSQETRPAIDSNPTEAERRYLNPTPSTFEEQEAPYQLALHAPYLAASIERAPSIQMQTYGRTRRKSGRRGSLDPRSEAGRTLIGADGVRQREVRENSDFLRVVVMEMNMRRSGKLETGRARLWLPPRQVSVACKSAGKVPRRWVGESAY